MSEILPYTNSPCRERTCVYNEDGLCEDPSINSGNSDAFCFNLSDDAILVMLRESLVEGGEGNVFS